MNKKQLLIAATVATFCGMNLVAENTKKPNVDILKTKGISQTVQYGCERNLTAECIALITYLEEAEKHIINQRNIASLECQKKELARKGSAQPFINELIEKDLKEAKENCPHYTKKYLDTLTPEQQEKFKYVVNTVVKKHADPSVYSIAYKLIAEALEK